MSFSTMKALVPLSLLFSSALSLSLPQPRDADSYSSSCRCFPGDSCWPSNSDWNAFNQSIGGKLIATVPIAAVCHNSSFAQYDAAKCKQLQSVWDLPETHYVTSSSPMAPIYANQSCDPFTAPSAQCIYGTYVRYAVNASGPSEYQKTIAFAQKRNIRLVIRNTGHDYLGKSTGPGALALWTHNIKNIDFIDYTGSSYTGKAVRVGAGVQAFEAYKAAHSRGLAIVGGLCQTVGIAGGYTQGGGHGPLASFFGLGADQVLEWDVITGTGQRLTATPKQNSDLYWALTGGGGGSYAVVLSMTVKAHQEPKVVAGNLTFTNANISQDTFFDIARTAISNMPAFSDAGAGSAWLLTNTTFLLAPLILPNSTRDQYLKLLQPTLAKLNASHVPYDMHATEFSSFYDGLQATDIYNTITEYSIGGRFIPRSLVDNSQGLTSLMSAFRYISEHNGAISGVSVNVTRFANPSINAVNPLWRTTAFDAVVGIPFDPLNFNNDRAAMNQITNDILPQLEKITPNGGAYINEGDPQQPNFQNTFYGNNYGRLSSIKSKYDPYATFYGLTAVGSEKWVQKPDGRLCRA